MKKLKKYFSSCLALLLIISLISPSVFADYFPKQHERSHEASNIALIYTGYYNPINYDGEKIGDYDKDKFLPYVGYLNEDGVAEDYFFDTFLMLALTSPHKGSLMRYYDWVADSKPGTLADWQWAMDRMFEENLQLNGLEQAVAQVSGELQDPDKKVNVYLLIPFPDPQSKDFGDFNGDGTVKNLEDLETRKALVKWYIDTMVSRFEAQNYQHLNLSGFYWLQEDLDVTVAGEAESIRYTVDYLNDQDMRLGWIPWSGAGEKARGNHFGFDFTIIQPNHFFEESTIKRVDDTADLAKSSYSGVEIEFDLRAVEQPWYRQAFYNYLISGVRKGFMQDSLIAYYQDVYAVHDMYHHESPVANQMYKDLYLFAKGQFQAPAGNFAGRVVDKEGAALTGATLKDELGRIIPVGTNGEFLMEDLYATQQKFTVEKSGFGSKDVTIVVPTDHTVYRDIVLTSLADRTIKESLLLADFEGAMIYGTNTGDYVKREINTNPAFVKEGNQSLKVDFEPYPEVDQWVRLYIDSDFSGFEDSMGSVYTQKDWSEYDSLTLSIYNPSNEMKEISLNIMQEYYWGSAFNKKMQLAPQQWTIVEQSIPELAQMGFNVQNAIRTTLQIDHLTPALTVYVDEMRLNKYANVDEFVLTDFEDSSVVFGTNNGSYMSAVIQDDPNFVHRGTKSLKVEYTATADGWVGAYIDSDYDGFQDPVLSTPSYTLKDWSAYDSVSLAVYNPSDNSVDLEVVYMPVYNWEATFTQNVTLVPHQWNLLEQSIQAMEQAGYNTTNMIRIALKHNDVVQGATIYVDDVKLSRTEGMQPAPDYVVQLPSEVPTMDIGDTWKPRVLNIAEKKPVQVDAQWTSSNPSVVEVKADGTLQAIAPGTAVIRAKVGNIEAQSKVVEVSPWKFNQLKGGSTPLDIGQTVKIHAISSFESGYRIPAGDVDLQWEITGDVIQKKSQQERYLEIEALQNGTALVKAAIHYNGKTVVLERKVQIGPSTPTQPIYPYYPPVDDKDETAKEPEEEQDKEAPIETESFMDVNEEHWAYPAIQFLVSHHIVNGYTDGSFRPDKSMTRAEITAILMRLLQQSDVELIEGNAFKDVAQDHWAKAYIETAAQLGLVNGMGEGIFAPDRPLTREQMVVMIARAFKIEGAGSELSFTDADQISDWALVALEQAVELGIISGYPDQTVRPKNDITRAEVAKILYELLNITE